MLSYQDSIQIFKKVWPHICSECKGILGSELHYQAMMYWCFRDFGNVPPQQIGMNVKIRVFDPITPLFRELDSKKHEDFQGGYEPIPDIVLFSPEIEGDFRRRNRENTLRHMLMAIEVKASERENARLRPGEIIRDLEKLKAFQNEASRRRSYVVPTMIIVDTTQEESEKMRASSLEEVACHVEKLNVGLFYTSRDDDQKWESDTSRLRI